MCILLVPSLEFAQLDEYEQKLMSFTSNKITLETYLHLTKQCLTQISGHPVREFNNELLFFSDHLFYLKYIANYCQNDHHLRSLLIQSCGHSIHVDCLSSYLKALHPVSVLFFRSKINNLETFTMRLDSFYCNQECASESSVECWEQYVSRKVPFL